MNTTLVWFRRDLRLSDQPALTAALARAGRVVPVFIHAPDEEGTWAPGAASRWWLHHSLAALGQQLAALGAPLVIRRGPTLGALRQLVTEAAADAVYWTRLYEPAAIARDREIKEALREQGLEVRSFKAGLLLEPFELKTGSGSPYRVFTPFWRSAVQRLGATSPSAAPLQLPSHPLRGLALDALELRPRIAWDAGFGAAWTPGEAGAGDKLERFCEVAAAGYKLRRDLPAEAGTSGLSPHLHFGEISPAQVLSRVRSLQTERCDAGLIENSDHFLREIGWREFAHHLLYHYPTTPETPLYERFAAFPWRKPGDYAEDLQAWQQGRTGVPIVDAGMRQLWSTGWMHNRVRMVVASYLTKNLLIPWQEGARWFWDTLVDADLASNTLGWQWAAGCGADAAPYFRIFNPVLQSEKFDASGLYVRRWVPELAGLTDPALHAPWLAKPPMLARAGVSLGDSYPMPRVDLAWSRDRALAAYRQIGSSDPV